MPPEKQSPTLERFRSFDPLAILDLYRFDIQTSGYILPETKRRSMDEELTYIAEGINRPLRTSFTLKEANGDLSYFDKGQWKPYLSTLTKGVETARIEAAADPRKTFLADRATEDLEIGYKLNELKPGQALIWYSKYPEKEAELYGDKFIGDLGFQARRKMGFLYKAERLFDGSLELVTQSVDNSDEEAFDVVMWAASASPNASIDEMRDAYDSVLSEKYESRFYAGRDLSREASKENAWDAINKNQDLVEYYFQELEALAYTLDMPRQDLERSKKRLTYGVWAALKNRLDQIAKPFIVVNSQVGNKLLLRQEINVAFAQASQRGEVMFGCGGALKGEDAILDASAEDVFDLIFGDKKVLKCVTCPLCEKEGVDATIKYENHGGKRVKVITCPDCKKSKTYNM